MNDTIDPPDVYRNLCTLFPDLPDSGEIRFEGEGFSSYALSIDDRWVFRIARNAETMAQHRREMVILPILRDCLPLAIPQPRWHSGPTEAFPYGLMGYPMLAGTPWTLELAEQVNQDRVTRQLGEFLSALHEFPVDEALAAGVLQVEAPVALVAEVRPALPVYFEAGTVESFYSWWASYQSNPEWYLYAPRLVHSDLWCENILLSPDLSHAVGVLDFEQMRIGDPVSEFAAMRYLGCGFMDRVRASYRRTDDLEPHFTERLRAAVILRELGGLRYALRYPEADELEDAVEKVSEALATG